MKLQQNQEYLTCKGDVNWDPQILNTEWISSNIHCPSRISSILLKIPENFWGDHTHVVTWL